MALLDEVDPHARAIGAVNTVARAAGRWVGSNTDAPGLVRSLREAGVEPQGREVIVLGAGGAARAAVVGLCSAGAQRVSVCARRSEEAQRLASELGAICAPASIRGGDLEADLAAALPSATLLIQATSATLGAAGAQFAAQLGLQRMPRGAAVCDLVYKPRQTAVLDHAAACGLQCVDGLGMLLHQGALAFERWTGMPAPVDIMRRALCDE
jgi:shikimate dehydrogenase